MLKKLSLIVIVAVLAYSQVGYYFLIRYHQHEQKELIKEKLVRELKDEELEIITLNDDQKIYWEEDGKEFLLNGEMYDVVKIKSVNDVKTLYCINDKKEKALIEKYNLVTKHNSSSDKKGKNTFDNSFNLFVYTDEVNAPGFLLCLQTFSFPNAVLPQAMIKQVSPPPKA